MRDRSKSWKESPPDPEYLRGLSWEQYRHELGVQMALARDVYEGHCQVCGKAFIGPKKRRFCSNTCLVRSRRAAHRQAQTVTE